MKRVLLASPRGYCAGVERAVETVERALDLYGAPGLRPQADRPQRPRRARPRGARRGVRRRRATTCRRARRSSSRRTASRRACTRSAAERGLNDDRRHLPARHEGARAGAALRGRRLHGSSSIGHAGHEEVVGHDGRGAGRRRARRVGRRRRGARPARPARRVAYITQTTLSVDETARDRGRPAAPLPELAGPQREDICYATSNRQWAVKELLAAGRPPARDRLAQLARTRTGSSRSARAAGVASHLIDDETEIDERWLDGRRDGRPHLGRVGAGAARRARLRLVPRARRRRHRAVRVRLRGRRLPAAGRATPGGSARPRRVRRVRDAPHRIERLPEQYFMALLARVAAAAARTASRSSTSAAATRRSGRRRTSSRRSPARRAAPRRRTATRRSRACPR